MDEIQTKVLRVFLLAILRLEVSVYNVYITNQFQVTFAWEWGLGEGGVKSIVEVIARRNTLKTLSTSKNSASNDML